MKILFYIFLIVIGLFVGWWLLKVLLGLYLPVERTARPYLLQLLRKAKINQVIPESCIRECVEESLKMAKSYAKLSGGDNRLRAELVKHLELQADMLRLWVRSHDPFDALYQIHYKTIAPWIKVPAPKVAQTDLVC